MEESIKVHTILQCFVDLNLETNELFPYDVQILTVSLNSNFYLTEEASILNVQVSLDQPSLLGLEETTVIISNITTSVDDVNVSGFPLRLLWEEGEQTKTISIPISRDFIEETDEDFMIGLTSLVNVLPGEHVQANVRIEDRTILRTVRIVAANMNTDISPLIDPNGRVFDGTRTAPTTQSPTTGFIGRINGINRNPDPVQERGGPRFDTVVGSGIENVIGFTVIEGEQVNISIGLDQPSEFGVEKVDITLFTNLSDGTEGSNPLVTLSAQRLEWAIGEQFKIVTVNPTRTNDFEGRRIMTLELRNPDSVKFDPIETHRVQILILDPPIDRRFTTINFGDIYKQRGSVISGTDPEHAESEVELRRISDSQVTNGSTLYWLVELGTAYVDEYNTPLVSESANYSAWPNYYFGLTQEGYPGNVSMLVINRGVGEVLYNNTAYQTGESFFVLMARDATTMTLPTNDGLVRMGEILFPDNITLTADTYTESRYEFALSIVLPQFQLTDGIGFSAPHGFQLKTTSNSYNMYPIGNFVLQNHPTASIANANSLALYSTYSNMRVRYDGSTCTNSFSGSGRVHDVRIKGIVLLSTNSLNTDYMTHEIGLNSDFNPICFSSAGNSNGLAWSSVPFEIL